MNTSLLLSLTALTVTDKSKDVFSIRAIAEDQLQPHFLKDCGYGRN